MAARVVLVVLNRRVVVRTVERAAAAIRVRVGAGGGGRGVGGGGGAGGGISGS